jgi:uncharacterized protein (DUF305 family)
MKKLSLITLICTFAIILTACQSSGTAQSSNNQSNSTTEASQNAVTEDLMSMRDRKGMTKESSPNAANAPYDLQFLDTMIEHHQDAINMAKPIVAKTDNAQLRAFAAKIIADQNKEISQLKDWRKKWFGGEPAAMNAEMPGMIESMKGVNPKKLETGGGKQLNLRFLDIMTRHHQGAITMSKEALDKAERAEIKTLANQIIKAQEAEINQMQEWKTAWSEQL